MTQDETFQQMSPSPLQPQARLQPHHWAELGRGNQPQGRGRTMLLLEVIQLSHPLPELRGISHKLPESLICLNKLHYLKSSGVNHLPASLPQELPPPPHLSNPG